MDWGGGRIGRATLPRGNRLVDWGLACHWTDSKLKVHPFYCILSVSPLPYLHRKAQAT